MAPFGTCEIFQKIGSKIKLSQNCFQKQKTDDINQHLNWLIFKLTNKLTKTESN